MKTITPTTTPCQRVTALLGLQAAAFVQTSVPLGVVFRRCDAVPPEEEVTDDGALRASWADLQTKFEKWAVGGAILTRAQAERVRSMMDAWFARHGALTGTVLDVGGGQALFRRWWTPAEADDVYVVVDPGVSIFSSPVPDIYQALYADDLSKPATLVEGVGEKLPFGDGVCDSVLIAGALDHTLGPAKVIAEASRCLKPGGRLVLFQDIEPEAGAAALHRPLLPRLLRLVRDPRTLVSYVHERWMSGDHHMHHFSNEDLRRLIRDAGLSLESESDLEAGNEMRAFVATKRAHE